MPQPTLVLPEAAHPLPPVKVPPESRYIVCDCYDPKHLEALVNAEVARGYAPVGSLVVIREGVNSYHFYQPLYLSGV